MVVEYLVELVPDVLYAVKWQEDEDHSLNIILDQFTNPMWLRDYVKTNQGHFNHNRYSKEEIVGQIVENVVEIVGEIYEKAESQEVTGKDVLRYMFVDLGKVHEEHLQPVYFNRPKKAKSSQIRVYALKNNLDCYVITGGAIKMSRRMDEHNDTKKELDKLKIADTFINEQS